MKISFHLDSSLPPQASDLIQRRCEFAFGRFESIIEEVIVTVTDENGPRGGDSIRCVVRVPMLRRPEVIIHEQADTFERAFGLAVERAGHQVAKQNSRRNHTTRTIRRESARLIEDAIPA